jgi:FSR family fosmidomycin resistance protein-like MFS transporter
LDSTAAISFRSDVKVIGVVGVVHGLSHFFQLVLPPLFPLLRAEFDVSYATLGALVGVFYVASGVCQFSAGFAVDRFGARPVLLGGLALMAGSVMVGSAVPGVYWLFPIALLMGIGNGVFHPADFAVLNANVNPKRLGYAYSIHGVGGNLGYALAPLASFGLGGAFGWRTALLVLGAAGLIAVGVLAMQRRALRSRAHDATPPQHTLAASLELFRQKPIVLCFAYFCVATVAGVGIQTFVGTSLHAAYDVSLLVATSALTAYFLGGTVGVLIGGYFATIAKHHDRVAAIGLTAAAAFMLLLAALPVLAQWSVTLLAAIGVAVGSTGPSRDMIVRNATPPGASGRVYGFVYSGLDLGATLGPVLIGVLLDHGSPRMVFVFIAAALLLAVATVVQVRRWPGARPAGAGAAD